MKVVWQFIKDYIRNTDKLIWLCCVAVSGIGCVLLLSIVRGRYSQLLGISNRNLAVQLAALALGVGAAFVLSNINYNFLKKLWFVHVPISYALVILTFFIGTGAAERPDDKRWLVVPGVDIWVQPAELLKISFILVFAYHIITVREEINKPLHILLLGLHAALPVVLIHFQGDDGTALLIAFIAVTMLFMAGINWKYIAGALVGLAAMLPLLWMYVLNDFQKQRILILLNQNEADPLGWYFQQYRAKIAIAIGGDTGVGLFEANSIYVPEIHTDFIFTFLCEAFGFMGALGVIALMLCLTFKLIYNSTQAADQYGSLICIGVVAMIFVQFVINVGMCLSLIPVIGNPFPFLSYGGTSMITNFLGIGLVQSVHMYRRRGMFSDAAL